MPNLGAVVTLFDSDWLLLFLMMFHHKFMVMKHPSSTLKTPINTLQTTFKIISLFSLKKLTKKINRDFIKGGWGGGSPFYEVISQKNLFFTNDGFPNIVLGFVIPRKCHRKWIKLTYGKCGEKCKQDPWRAAH